MTDNADRVPYSYDEIFPERFLHAPDLDGQTVTLTISDAWGEYVQNPKQKRQKERGDLCGILAFRGTKREYATSKQNAWILKTIWGKDPAGYIGKRITISPVPDASGFTEHNTRILFVGSPDIDNDLSLTLPGGQRVVFKKTAPGPDTITEPSVGNDEIITEADYYRLCAEIDRVGMTIAVVKRNLAARATYNGELEDMPVAVFEKLMAGLATKADKKPPQEDPTPPDAVAGPDSAAEAVPRASAKTLAALMAAAERVGLYPVQVAALADKRFGIEDVEALNDDQARVLIAEMEGAGTNV